MADKVLSDAINSVQKAVDTVKTGAVSVDHASSISIIIKPLQDALGLLQKPNLPPNSDVQITALANLISELQDELSTICRKQEDASKAAGTPIAQNVLYEAYHDIWVCTSSIKSSIYPLLSGDDSQNQLLPNQTSKDSFVLHSENIYDSGDVEKVMEAPLPLSELRKYIRDSEQKEDNELHSDESFDSDDEYVKPDASDDAPPKPRVVRKKKKVEQNWVSTEEHHEPSPPKNEAEEVIPIAAKKAEQSFAPVHKKPAPKQDPVVIKHTPAPTPQAPPAAAPAPRPAAPPPAPPAAAQKSCCVIS